MFAARILLALLLSLFSAHGIAQTVQNTQTVHVTSIAALQALDKTKFSTTHPVIVSAGPQSGLFLRDNSDLTATVITAFDTASAVDSGTEIITTATAHELFTGDAVLSTTAVNGLSLNTVYYVIRASATTFQLSTSLQNAFAGTAFNLTGTTLFTVGNLRDPLQAVYVYTTGDALNGDNGAWIRQGSFDEVNAAWFGAVADEAADNAEELTAAIKFAEAQAIGGTVRLPNNRGSGSRCALTSLPLVINRPGVKLKGASASETNDLTDLTGTCIRGSGTDGPVIRWTAAFGGGEDFIVRATSGRTNATAITGASYAGAGKDRDDQNFGIWVEGLNEAGTQVVGYFRFENVWVDAQPNANWSFVGATYQGVIDGGGSTRSKSHGIAITSGDFTARTSELATGIIDIRSFESHGNDGHAVVVGYPTEGRGNVVRVLMDSVDAYNNANNTALLLTNAEEYEVYFVGDNLRWIGGAINGENGADDNGAMMVAGRHMNIENVRFLDMDKDDSAIFVEGTHNGSATTSGIDIRLPFFEMSDEGGAMTCAVRTSDGATAVHVFDPTSDGAAANLVCGDATSGAAADLGASYAMHITIPDDDAAAFAMSTTSYGIVSIATNLTGGLAGAAHVKVNTGGFCNRGWGTTAAAAVCSTGVKDGNDGVDTNLTISPDTASNTIYVENRTGASVDLYMSFMGKGYILSATLN